MQGFADHCGKIDRNTKPLQPNFGGKMSEQQENSATPPTQAGPVAREQRLVNQRRSHNCGTDQSHNQYGGFHEAYLYIRSSAHAILGTSKNELIKADSRAKYVLCPED
jgi:hypothetical protein